MRQAGLVLCERVGTELRYRAKTDHPQASLLTQLSGVSQEAARAPERDHDESVRTWLAAVGAPIVAFRSSAALPRLEVVLAEAVKLSHRDSTVARVLPFVLWQHRNDLDFDRLAVEVTRSDERQALGCFLDLAGLLGGDAALARVARNLKDKRRKRERIFFDGSHGRYASRLARRNTPARARRWGFLMNMDLDAFKSVFDKFAEAH